MGKEYQERSIGGRAWRRTHRVEILNPKGGTPSIRFDEEDIVEFAGKVTATPGESVFCEFDPTFQIDVLDTETLEPTGVKVTMAECYLAIFSLYIALGKARDLTAPNPLSQP